MFRFSSPPRQQLYKLSTRSRCPRRRLVSVQYDVPSSLCCSSEAASREASWVSVGRIERLKLRALELANGRPASIPALSPHQGKRAIPCPTQRVTPRPPRLRGRNC